MAPHWRGPSLVPIGLRVQLCYGLVTPKVGRPQRQPSMPAWYHVHRDNESLSPLFIRLGARVGVTVVRQLHLPCHEINGAHGIVFG
jgi:hypothetical protein